MALPIFDLASKAGRAGFEERLAALRASVSSSGEAAATVAQIVDDVRTRGDDAVVGYMRKWTDPAFTADRIRVDRADLKRALRAMDRDVRKALSRAIENVGKYQRHILPRAIKPARIAGAELGLRFTPVASVGLAVPGGKASYPSSVVMLAVPALSAGVKAGAIHVVTPPPTRGPKTPPGDKLDVSPLVLGACAMLGVDNVYRIGGAQAMAALAYGTDAVRKVDMIVGPGNVYTQLAKQRLSGVVGIDGFYGPSEIVTLADDSADPRRVAADLIAQAEHDPGRCFLVCWSKRVMEAIVKEVTAQAAARARIGAIEQSLRDWSAGVLVKNERQAIEVADTLAAEHVNLAVRCPDALLAKLRHGGEFFLGDATPVAAGDYFAGPSHCLPTATTARFASGISVYTFLKRSGTVWYRKGMPREAIDAVARLAEAEGLDGHAASARGRGK